jgi:hypothetical protein
VSPRIRCREIVATDLDAVSDLLTRGFRRRPRSFWVNALRRLSDHPTIPGLPRHGYLLEAGRGPVGVVLLIASAIPATGDVRIRCNVSSWYVEPAFRGYAALLVSRALKHKHVTYVNITPDRPTLPILEAQGYTRYCDGRFVAVAALCEWSRRMEIETIRHDVFAGEDLSPFEAKLLQRHADYGCISMICRSSDRRHPFVFLPRRKSGLIPFAYLAYCRSVEDFLRCAGPIGRFLAYRGLPLIVLDANGRIDGLIGKYSDGAPKYFKGPERPRLEDMAYSERVMFGF